MAIKLVSPGEGNSPRECADDELRKVGQLEGVRSEWKATLVEIGLEIQAFGLIDKKREESYLHALNLALHPRAKQIRQILSNQEKKVKANVLTSQNHAFISPLPLLPLYFSHQKTPPNPQSPHPSPRQTTKCQPTAQAIA